MLGETLGKEDNDLALLFFFLGGLRNAAGHGMQQANCAPGFCQD